jgi:hypothetical protein
MTIAQCLELVQLLHPIGFSHELVAKCQKMIHLVANAGGEQCQHALNIPLMHVPYIAFFLLHDEIIVLSISYT